MSNENKLTLSRRQALAMSAAAGIFAGAPAWAQSGKPIASTLNAGQERPAINPYIYGGFLEHIGDLINHSLWSEVLDDRKFYHPIDSKPVPKPEGRPGRNRETNKWRPVGPDAAVTMDRKAPWVGAQSPVVALAGTEPRGIAQSGLALAVKDYVGRVVIAADAGADISATLIWGSADGDRQTVKIAATQTWSKVPLRFSPKVDTVKV